MISKTQKHYLIDLIKRSEDKGYGWRNCSQNCWEMITKLLDDTNHTHIDVEGHILQINHETHTVRIKDINHVVNEIESWKSETKKQIDLYDRLQKSKIMAGNLL